MKTKTLTMMTLLAAITGSNAQNLLTNSSFEDNGYANGAIPIIGGHAGAAYGNVHTDGTGPAAGETSVGSPNGWVTYGSRATGVINEQSRYTHNWHSWRDGNAATANGLSGYYVETEDQTQYQYGAPYAVPDGSWALGLDAGTYAGQEVDFITGEEYTLSFMARGDRDINDYADLMIGTSIDSLYNEVDGTWARDNNYAPTPNVGVFDPNIATETFASPTDFAEWREVTYTFTATDDMDGIYFAPKDLSGARTSSIFIDNVSLIGPTAVPEPSALLLVGLGSLGLISRRKR